VNISPIQMRHRDFVRWLREVAHSVDGGIGLDIEITKSAVMEEVEQNIPKIEAAREMGFHIAIDDFGTGYSSLSYLTKLPVHALKIDRSFIVTMAESPGSLAIVTSIISLAHSLNLQVIAEGVELEEQAKLLRLLRCEQIQGHLFSQAMPADQIAALLASG
jgi:EAL domain-containing protein (putative c-di-GMP-specific phosphodiesterase class I)